MVRLHYIQLLRPFWLVKVRILEFWFVKISSTYRNVEKNWENRYSITRRFRQLEIWSFFLAKFWIEIWMAVKRMENEINEFLIFWTLMVDLGDWWVSDSEKMLSKSRESAISSASSVADKFNPLGNMFNIFGGIGLPGNLPVAQSVPVFSKELEKNVPFVIVINCYVLL